MHLCINEKDEEGESEAQAVVRAKKRAGGWGGGALSLFIFLVDAKVHSHLTCHVSLCDGPRLVLLSFGLVAPTCFIDIWPRLVFPALAPTCFIVILARADPDLF